MLPLNLSLGIVAVTVILLFSTEWLTETVSVTVPARFVSFSDSGVIPVLTLNWVTNFSTETSERVRFSRSSLYPIFCYHNYYAILDYYVCFSFIHGNVS